MSTPGAALARDYLKQQVAAQAAAADAGKPSLVTVTQVVGDLVAVQYPGAATAGGQLFAHAAGQTVAVGDTGLLQPIAGGLGAFIKLGSNATLGAISQRLSGFHFTDLFSVLQFGTPFDVYEDGSVAGQLDINLIDLSSLLFVQPDSADDADTTSTTNTGTFVTGYSKTYTLPTGTWDCVIQGQLVLSRSVGTGQVQVRMNAMGAQTGAKVIGYSVASDRLTAQANINRASQSGAITYAIEYSGGSTAGTTSADNPMLLLLAYRTA